MSYEYPTSSRANNTFKEEVLQTNVNDDFELYIQNDKAELELLEPVDSGKSNDEDVNAKAVEDDERVAKIKFNCYLCGMEELVHYFGVEPDFVLGIKFNEPTYVMRDPFQPPPPRRQPKAEYFVALGAHCKLCNNTVCKDNECSFFYINSYCINCVKKVANSFPLDIQQKLKKQLSLI